MCEKRIMIMALLVCFASSPATLTADPLVTRAPTPPSADVRFSAPDMAARINRNAMLNNSNECASATVKSASPSVVGIGNVYTKGATTGAIVNQTEIHNSTIIIQNK